MSSDIPDWLRELTPEEEEEAEEEAVAPPPVEGASAFDPMADLLAPMEDDDDAYPTAADEASVQRKRKQKRQSLSFNLGLKPWQGFFLSVLLFFDVLIIGLLFLVMLERISIPVL